jgi:hypothetical protein
MLVSGFQRLSRIPVFFKGFLGFWFGELKYWRVINLCVDGMVSLSPGAPNWLRGW